MKYIRLCAVVLLLALCLSCPVMAEDAPSVSAASAILTDAESGRVLFEKNTDEPRLIASTTKIMTAMIALEHCAPDRSVVIDPAWTGIEGSSMYLKPGQELTIRELLTGLMLASGNDAAVALACITAGSVEDFAVLMNEKAAELGCKNTHFENPNGLDSESHYSSARDLAIITREALKSEEFCRIASQTTETIGELTYTNHNRLLSECEGVFGVKTGYTMAAGRTLVTCCERKGRTLICVTLSDPDDWRDHASLYEWAYSEYEPAYVPAETPFWEIPVISGDTDSVSVSASAPLEIFVRDGERVTLSMELPGFIYAPVESGDSAGMATVMIDSIPVGSVSLIYDADVSRTEEETPGFWQRLAEIFGRGERKIYTLS